MKLRVHLRARKKDARDAQFSERDLFRTAPPEFRRCEQAVEYFLARAAASKPFDLRAACTAASHLTWPILQKAVMTQREIEINS